MQFTSLVASALLLASVGLASPTPATEGTLKARMLKDVTSKSGEFLSLLEEEIVFFSHLY